MKYQELGTEIGELVDRKNAAYGASCSKSGEYLRLLYPHSLRPDQYADAVLLARDFDKSMRIAVDNDAFGESPWDDKAGYALLGARMHRERKNEGCGSVRVGADEKSQEPNASAEPDASAPITPSAAASSAPSSPPPSPKPHAQSSNATDAHTVAADAKANVDGLVGRARNRNGVLQCGICTGSMHTRWMSAAAAGEFLYFCSQGCRADFHRMLTKAAEGRAI
jgi:hypothetical protein